MVLSMQRTHALTSDVRAHCSIVPDCTLKPSERLAGLGGCGAYAWRRAQRIARERQAAVCTVAQRLYHDYQHARALYACCCCSWQVAGRAT